MSSIVLISGLSARTMTWKDGEQTDLTPGTVLSQSQDPKNSGFPRFQNFESKDSPSEAIVTKNLGPASPALNEAAPSSNADSTEAGASLDDSDEPLALPSAPTGADVTPISNIETIFQGKFPGDISREIKQFGYDVFKQETNDFMPMGDVPISPDYIIGPGDSFTINVWGSTNFSQSVTVRRDGNIFIPNVGAIEVWRKTYAQMEKSIRSRLQQMFKGIKINIAFEAIRKIEVFVVGEVQKPGSYSIPSTSSAINALFYSGGPTKKGSLRQVQILRGNKLLTKVDLYDFLIYGKAQGYQLQSQDVILVPVIGKLAALAGAVKRPAIYEILDKTDLFDLIEMAGGLNFAGQIGRLSLERVLENRERVTRDFIIPENFNELNAEVAKRSDLGTTLVDGDFVQIFSVLPSLKQTVFLRGHAKREGSYEFRAGMTLKELIPNFDTLKSEPYTKFIQIIRTIPPKDDKQSVFVDLSRMLEGDESQNIELQERDEIIIFSEKELDLQRKVYIDGRVNYPGEYLYFDGMTLRDLIFMAGNVKEDAYLTRAEIARYKVEESGLKPERLQVNLKEVIAEPPSNNPALQARDRVFVHGLPNWETSNFISVQGEIKYPGSYPFLPGERLSSVLKRAGGFTDKAFLMGAVYTRESVKKMQQERLKHQVAELEEAVLQQSLPVESDLLSAADLQSSKEALTARRTLLRQLQDSEVSGRMVIRLEKLNDFTGSQMDIALEAGDSLTIPTTPSTVLVMGEVYNEMSVVYEPGKTIGDYVGQAGGTTINADNDSIFLIKADGTVISRRQNRGFLLRNFYQAEVDRGDSILVPKDITRFSWMRTTKDITEILFKIASTTGITIAAFK